MKDGSVALQAGSQRQSSATQAGAEDDQQNDRMRRRLRMRYLVPMTGTLLLLLIATLAGIAVAVQGQFMGTMDRTAGTATSVFITYGLGALIAAAIWLAKRGPSESLRQIPWYAWSAGAFGLVIVGGIGYAAPRLGLSKTILVTIAAQLAAAVVIDHFGLFAAPQRALDAGRLAGLALTFAGAWLIVRG